jgi:predicted O-linked N-acetylglucosamine transferase (SPINDLY family)
MSQDNGYINDNNVSTPRWIPLAVIALAAVSVIGFGVAWSATSHARSTEQGLEAQTQQNHTFQQGMGAINQRLSQSEETNAQLEAELKLVTDRMKMTQGELANARQQAKQIRTEYSEKIDSVQSQMATKADAADVTTLGGDLNGVKSDLASAKDGLQMTRGEFGTLIARNHDEIDQLRRMGERDYYEFTVNGKGQKSRVGSLSLELRDANIKKNQFTVALYVDDMRIEKKNRSIDEPIYFYTRGNRAPAELVINKIGKNQVTGYLSMPKAVSQTPAVATSGN